MWGPELGAVAWLVAFSLQLRSLYSRQPGCAPGPSFVGTWAAADSSGCFLLWSLGPLLTSVSLFAVLADSGRGRRTAMGLRRVAVASPCLTQLAMALLQPASAPSQNWWLWPLASAVLALTNQDAAAITAVQASVLYTTSATSVALDVARRTWQAAAASAAAAAATTATASSPSLEMAESQPRSGPGPGLLPQLAGRVVALAVLHVLLAVLGIWVDRDVGAPGRSRRLREGGAAAGAGRRRRGQQQQVQRPQAMQKWMALEHRADGGHVRMRLGLPEATTGLEQEALVAAAEWPVAAAVAAADAAACVEGSGSHAHSHVTSPAATKEAGSNPAMQAVMPPELWQQQRGPEQQHHQTLLLLRGPRDNGWHGDFATERRHVVATRLADAALLAYDFLEAYHCFCGAAAGTAAPPRGGADASGGAAGRVMGAAAGGAYGPARGGGVSGVAALRQLRCLGALLVTSWGASVLVMNALVILWPRPRRSRHAWVLNSACGWLAGLARAALLLVLAPPPPLQHHNAGTAAWQPRREAASTAADWPVLAAAGGGSGSNGRPVLAAAIVLLSHLIASNLPPRAFRLQAAAAAAAGALLHSRLAAPPATTLAFLYGGVWLAAVALSHLLARACRHSLSQDGPAAMGAPLPPTPLVEQAVQLPPQRQHCGGGGAAGALPAEADQLTSVSSSSTHCMPPPDPDQHGGPRVLRPPRLGLGLGMSRAVSRTFSSADGAASPGSTGGSAAAAAASNLALRTLSRTASPRLSAMGGMQQQYPQPHSQLHLRSHSGVSSCSARASEAHPHPHPPPPHSRTTGSASPNAAASPRGQGISDPATAAPAPAPAAFGLGGIRGAGRPASNEPAPPRRPPPAPAAALPPAAPQLRTSLDSRTTRSLTPPHRTSSLDPRSLQRTPSAAGVQPTTSACGDGSGGSAATGTYSPFVFGAPPGRLSRCGKPLDATTTAAAGGSVSYMRRASSERPTGLRQPATSAPPPQSLLQHACSCGPLQVPRGGVAIRPCMRDAFPGSAAAAEGAAQLGAPPPLRGSMTGTWFAAAAAAAVQPAAPTPTAAAAAGRASVAGQGSAAPLQARPLSPMASAPAAAGGSGAEHSVLSSVILEADMYDRLLSSASSPFLLNPGGGAAAAAATTAVRLPGLGSVANTGTLPLSGLPGSVASPTSVERRGQHHHYQYQQQYQQQQQQQLMTQSGRTSSGLSETWSAFGQPVPSAGNLLMGTGSYGGGAFAPGATAAAGAAAAAAALGVPAAAHRRALQPEGSDGGGEAGLELRRGGETGALSCGGGGGGDAGWSRVATGSRSRLDRSAAAVVQEAWPPVPAPRQIIVLADGRQVYQSETLAAAASVSPPGSATPLRSPSLHTFGGGAQPPERPWSAAAAAAGRDLGSMARSDIDAPTAVNGPPALPMSQTSSAAVSRHSSYTVRGGAAATATAIGDAGGGGGQSSSLDPLSSSPTSHSPYSPRSASGAQWGDGKPGGAAGEAGRGWAVAAARSPQPQSPWSRSQANLQRAASGGMAAAATATLGRGDRGFGFGGSTSVRTSYSPRGGGGGTTSASSRFSGSYGPASGGGGSAYTMSGTSGLTSYGTAETGGSLSGGGAAGSGGGAAAGSGGGGRGAPPASYHRSSLDLGRHLHDTGLIRIGEEDAITENDGEGDDRPASTLFGTCDDGDGASSILAIGSGPGGTGVAGAGDRFMYGTGGGLSVGYGSESDRRSSATTERPSVGTTSGDTTRLTVAARRPDGSSSIGSIATGGDATATTGSVPLALVAAAAAPPPPRGRRGGRVRLGRAGSGSPRRQDAAAAATGVGSASGSSWSAAGGGTHGGSAGRLGSVASGASFRGLSDSPTLQTLLRTQSHTVASSSGLLPQLPVASVAAAAAAAAGGGASVKAGGIVGSGGGGSGGGGSGGSATAAASGGAAAVTVSFGRHLLSGGGSHLSSSNPSLLSFADVTLGFGLTPVSAGAAASAAGANITTGGSCNSPGQSAAATALSGAGVLVTLARGLVGESPIQSDAMNAAGGDDDRFDGAAAAVARVARRQAAAAAAAAVSAASGGAASGAAGSEGLGTVRQSGSLRFLAYPQTLASMVQGSGSIGRGTYAGLRTAGAAAAMVGVTATPTSSGAAPRGSNATAASSSGRLGGVLSGGAGGGADGRAGSRPTIPELLASTAAAAAAIGAGAVAASPWVSPPSSAQLPAAPAAAAAGAPGGGAAALAKQPSLRSYRLHLDLFTAEEVSCGVEASAAAEGSCSTGAGSHPTADAAAGPRTTSATTTTAAAANTAALPSQPLPSGPLSSSQPLSPGRGRAVSWFGHFLTAKRTSTMGAIDGAAAADTPLPPEHHHHHQQQYGIGGGEEAHGRDGRASATASAAGRSSQQLTRLMDDTARLSPVRGVLRGIRKRLQSGVKSLSGGRQQ